MSVFEILRTGSENATDGGDLCRLLGLRRRDLSRIVEAERRAGVPICANTTGAPGYYLAASREEMEAYCRSLEGRAEELLKTLRACRKTAASLPARSDGDAPR